VNQILNLFASTLPLALSEAVANMDVEQLEAFMASLKAVQSEVEDIDEETALALCQYILQPQPLPPTLAQEMAGMSDVDLTAITQAPTTQPDQKYLAQAELLVRQGQLEEPKTTDKWPIDYNKVRAWRQRELVLYQEDPQYLANRKAFYASGVNGCIAFINHWIDTHEPRNAGKRDPVTGRPLETVMPLILFKRQEEMIRFGFACLDNEANGLIEKSRDMGATWTWLAVSIWMWLFWDACSVGWGTATAIKLDRSGDTGSIFVKLRQTIKNLPSVFKPKDLIPHRHLLDKRVSNPNNGSSIFGEIGEEIGRGSRARIYFVDESAHLEHPEEVEAALSETTRVRIDMSSVSGLGSVFHRTRMGGKVWEPGKDIEIVSDRTNVFILDWSHHPGKNRDWYTTRAKLFASKGLSHIFASEVDRDYAAALQGTVIPKAWLESCVDAHLKIEGWVDDEDDPWFGGFDVADGGLATNAVVKRRAWIVKYADQWGGDDTSTNTRRAVNGCADTLPIFLSYDSVGVGAGVRGEANRLKAEGVLPHGITMSPWNGGGKVQWPGKRLIVDDEASPKNKAYFANLKAQGWWNLRMRVYRTHRYIAHNEPSPIDSLISFDSKAIGPLLYKLIEELGQPTAQPNTLMKLQVDKTPDGAQSPNLGDAAMMCCFPLRDRAAEHLQALAQPLVVNAGQNCLQCGSRRTHALGGKRYQCHACGHIGDWDNDHGDVGARSKTLIISSSFGIQRR
jgi:hypothetical protein